MVYKTVFLSAGDGILENRISMKHQMNQISMISYNTRSSSAGEILLDPDKHDIT